MAASLVEVAHDSTAHPYRIAGSILSGDMVGVSFTRPRAAPPASFVLPTLVPAGARYSFWMATDAEMDGAWRHCHSAPSP